MLETVKKFLTWVKTHKALSIVAAIAIYWVYTNLYGISPLSLRTVQYQEFSEGSGPLGVSAPRSTQVGKIGLPSIRPPIGGEAPPMQTEDRLVVQETNLSLLIKDVRQTTDAILNFVKDQGGYMVSSSLTQPEEAPFATLVVRVPSDKLREVVEYFRSLAIKVSSEYLSGLDVTDEYVDIDSRLLTLEKNKARFEEIMDQATRIEDILRVQQEIISLQAQIDNLKGRQLYLEQTAKLSRVTVYLSTDEIALPYAPSETFRPEVIVKLAVRSLIRHLRQLATYAIWIVVYAVIWIPVLFLILLVKHWRAKKAVN